MGSVFCTRVNGELTDSILKQVGDIANSVTRINDTIVFSMLREEHGYKAFSTIKTRYLICANGSLYEDIIKTGDILTPVRFVERMRNLYGKI